MYINEITQVITGFIGTFFFGILFNMRGKHLLIASLGGFLSSLIFVVLGNFAISEPIIFFIVATLISFYAEVMARKLRTPATSIATVALIPLIPGSSLYHTMASAFEGDFELFLNKAVYTVKLAFALALGIIITTAISRFIFKKPKNA